MKENGVWRTIHGAKVFIRNGETPMDAFIRQQGKRKKTRYSVKYGEDEKEFRTYKEALEFAKKNPKSEKIYEHNKDGSNFEKLDIQRDLIDKGKLNITASRALENIKSSLDDEGIIVGFDLEDYLENGGSEKEIEKIAGKNWKRKIEK